MIQLCNIAKLDDSMKRGPLLEFRVEKNYKSKIRENLFTWKPEKPRLLEHTSKPI